MSSTELQRRAALAVGDLVYYNTIQSGRVPCRIVGTEPHLFASDDERHGSRLVLKVTGARYAYPRGHTFTTHRGPFVQARPPIR